MTRQPPAPEDHQPVELDGTRTDRPVRARLRPRGNQASADQNGGSVRASTIDGNYTK
jgi:hypothetical protein